MVRPRGLSASSSVSSVPDQDQVCLLFFLPLILGCFNSRLSLPLMPPLSADHLGTGEHVRLPRQSHPARSQWRRKVSRTAAIEYLRPRLVRHSK